MATGMAPCSILASTLVSAPVCLLVLLLACVQGEDQRPASRVILLDQLPEGFSSQSPAAFDIRTNFSGSVQFIESRDFHVVVKVTAPKLQQANDVDATLFERNGKMVLQIGETKSAPSAVVNLLWLFLGLTVATCMVGICTAWHASQWYKQETGKLDASDHKSLASSSQRGCVFRQTHGLQVGLGAGDHGVQDTDPIRNLRSDDELRQVPEMPEEEEAEAIEMEQLSKLKLKDDSRLSPDNEDSDPQERNLIESRIHSQAKTVHKDLIKKPNSGKKVVSYRRTSNGLYKGVPTEQDEASNDETDVNEKEVRLERSGNKYETFMAASVQMSAVKPNIKKEKSFNGNEISNTGDASQTEGVSDVYGFVDVHNGAGSSAPAELSPINQKFVKPQNTSEPTPVMSTFGATSTPRSGHQALKPVFEPHRPDSLGQSAAGLFSIEAQWSGLASMDDILEDMREEDESTESRSICGSSEIFGIGNDTPAYYNLDSDLDLPPLDAEDIFNDRELPSPAAYPAYRLFEKGRVNDDIKLIPGALKSPGANTGRLVNPPKPRPNSSIILRARAVQDSSSAADNDSDESPPLPPPPPPEGKSQPVPETVFEFPPPPKFYKLPQHIVARREQEARMEQQTKVEQDPDNGDEYVQIKGSEKDPHSREKSTNNKGGRRGLPLNPTYMNLTVLTTLCLMTLVTAGSRPGTSPDTRVDVQVYAPASFLTNSTRIFFLYGKDTELVSSKETNVLVYDVHQPLIHQNLASPRSCVNISCEHGCDENSGQCICFKGFRISADFECIDVNECMEGKAKCDPAAGCFNRKGSYDCICGEDFYGNGKTCRECKLDCPEKYYEVQPCSAEVQKICKACTNSCRDGYYMALPCSRHENAICRVCRPACSPGEFESRQCTNDHDRECNSITLLSLPVSSKNVILEEKNHIQDDEAKLDKLPLHYVGFTRYKLFRGTGIHLEITVRFIDAAQQFLPINTSQLNDFIPDSFKSTNVLRYCPSPTPDYYILRYNKQEGVTFKQNDNGSIDACEAQKPSAGNLWSSQGSSNRSFLCSQPGSLTNIFSVEEDFFQARTKWVDKSKRCQRNSRACESCTRKCGTDHMFSGDPTCSVAGSSGTGEDSVDSPRLMMCYNCCVKKNCSSDCKDYHKRRCQPEQCTKGNLLEFTLEPSWDSSQEKRFYCPIGPARGQHLLELDYSVYAESVEAPLHMSKIVIYGDKKWEETGVMHHSDGILDITVNSSLGTAPDFLEGSLGPLSHIFKVGTYKTQGAALGSSSIRPDSVFVRPAKPHQVPSMPHAHQECTFTELNSMLLASNMDNPYIQDWALEAVVNGSLPFVVYNKVQDPVVLATLSQNVSVLKQLFAPVTFNTKSFSGDLAQNSTHWLLSIEGEVQRCPGFLQVSLVDSHYPTVTLFECDLAILCPRTFSLNFTIPSSDRLGLAKDFILIISDEIGNHHFRMYRKPTKIEESKALTGDQSPADATSSKQTAVRETKARETKVRQRSEIPDVPLPVPYLLMLGGSIILLIVLAILSLCFQPALPVPDTSNAKWYHPFLAVGYMMFQFAYSTFISATVFFLIVSVVTHEHVEHVSFITHEQLSLLSLTPTHVKLLQLQHHLDQEIGRQDAYSNGVQEVCTQDVLKIVDDMKKYHQSLLNSTKDHFERHRLYVLLSQQKLYARDKLMKDLENFRNLYAKAARSILRQVNQNALASFHNIQYNNTWLDGVRFLHEAVNLYLKARQKKQKSFMDWIGIEADLSKLEIDLSFSLPALPRLDDIPVSPPHSPPVKRNSPQMMTEKDPIKSIQVHNNWFFPLQESGLGEPFVFQQNSPTSDESERSKKETSLPFYLFLLVFITIDLVLLTHRMCVAWCKARLLLFGFPEYFREQKEAGDNDSVFQSQEASSTPDSGKMCKNVQALQTLKNFFIRIMSTTFLPKMFASVATYVVLHYLLHFSNQYLTVKELEKIGLNQNSDHYLDLQINMTNARIEAHAMHINTVDFPAFQAFMNSYVLRHKSVLNMYRQHLKGLKSLSDEMYCLHLKTIEVEGNCSDSTHQSSDSDKTQWNSLASMAYACKFQALDPTLFNRISLEEAPATEMQLEAILDSVRYIIYYTSQMMAIYLAVIVLKELASEVLWILIQRSGIIRLKIIVEFDQDDSVQ